MAIERAYFDGLTARSRRRFSIGFTDRRDRDRPIRPQVIPRQSRLLAECACDGKVLISRHQTNLVPKVRPRVRDYHIPQRNLPAFDRSEGDREAPGRTGGRMPKNLRAIIRRGPDRQRVDDGNPASEVA